MSAPPPRLPSADRRDSAGRGSGRGFAWIPWAAALAVVVGALGIWVLLPRAGRAPAGPFPFLWPLFPLGLLLVLAVVFTVGRWAWWGRGGNGGTRGCYGPVAREVLRERYARGEISRDDLREMSRVLDESVDR
ncbi:MAG: hypothetical protein ACRECT_02750 [Thermoplasmata archaeon]